MSNNRKLYHMCPKYNYLQRRSLNDEKKYKNVINSISGAATIKITVTNMNVGGLKFTIKSQSPQLGT